jgi:hypothetical protein
MSTLKHRVLPFIISYNEIDEIKDDSGVDVYRVVNDGYGEIIHYRNNVYHRDNDLPAVVYLDEYKHWYQGGLHHRDNDLPAYENNTGTKIWFKHGKVHRDGDKPAIINNSYKAWVKNSQFHRDETVDGITLPAVVYEDGSKFWFQYNMVHQDKMVNGKLLPAIIFNDRSTSYYIGDVKVDEKGEPLFKLITSDGKQDRELMAAMTSGWDA